VADFRVRDGLGIKWAGLEELRHESDAVVYS
jgi:hypothetical protein